MNKRKSLLLGLAVLAILSFGNNLILLVSTHKMNGLGMLQYLMFPLVMIFGFMYMFFQTIPDKINDRRMKQALEIALKQNQFRMVYQPIISLEDDSVSLEALIRWEREGKKVMPLQFIPALEEMGKMGELTYWIAKQACKDFKEWKEYCPDINQISINITSSCCTLDFLNYFNEILEQEELSPSDICIEITENIQLNKEILSFMSECSAAGYTIAIDDFGTGYSSLGYLMKYNFDVLKIDKSFVHEIDVNDTKYEIIKMMIQLGKQLNMRIVAEGVENKEQFHILRQLRVERVQGFYLSRPVEVKKWHRKELESSSEFF